MVKVLSNHMRGVDRVLLRRYANWVLRKFVRPSILNKSTIIIKVITAAELTDRSDYSDFNDAKAWMFYEGVVDGKKKFTVILNAERQGKKAKLPWIRIKMLMMNVGHEMIHIKQYLNNELFDYVDGKARYKGQVFHTGHSDDLEKYFDSPWEIEAYGREYGLYKVFVKKIKAELKEKNKNK
jgi:hypothetical protein